MRRITVARFLAFKCEAGSHNTSPGCPHFFRPDPSLVTWARSTFPSCSTAQHRKPSGVTSLNKNIGLINAAPGSCVRSSKSQTRQQQPRGIINLHGRTRQPCPSEKTAHCLLATTHRLTPSQHSAAQTDPQIGKSGPQIVIISDVGSPWLMD